MSGLDKDSITCRERKALVRSYLGETVKIKIDRPIGYVHKKGSYSLTYPINYGYIPGVIGGDGEELDVYLLGVNEPVSEYEVQIIGIALREDDVEDKLVAAPVGKVFYQNEIAEAIHFQERYYKTTIEALYERSAEEDSFLLCYCGHDCSKCVTYIATKKNDDSLRKQAQRFYKEEFGLDMPLEEFNCEGGRTENVFVLCERCPFIKCCNEHGVSSCNNCPEYPCKEISEYQAKYVNKCNQI